MENGVIISHGAFVYAKNTNRFLFLLRQGRQRWIYHWGIVGGKQEANETPLKTLKREAQEEVDYFFNCMPTPIDHYTSEDGNFSFHTAGYHWKNFQDLCTQVCFQVLKKKIQLTDCKK
jgi:8-oxo-dGTP pyrophosphatase MutT (NUDIX family)